MIGIDRCIEGDVLNDARTGLGQTLLKVIQTTEGILEGLLGVNRQHISNQGQRAVPVINNDQIAHKV